MSINAAAAFFQSTVADAGLQRKIAAATAGKEPLEKAEAVAELGRSAGFDFTPSEAVQVRATVRQLLIERGLIDDELDELDLQAVTGGTTKTEAAIAAQSPKDSNKGAGGADKLVDTAGSVGEVLVDVAVAGSGGIVGTVAGGFVDVGKATVDTAKSIFSGW